MQEKSVSCRLTGHVEDGVVEVSAGVEAVELHEEDIVAVDLEVDLGDVVERRLDTNTEGDTAGSEVPEVKVAEDQNMCD